MPAAKSKAKTPSKAAKAATPTKSAGKKSSKKVELAVTDTPSQLKSPKATTAGSKRRGGDNKSLPDAIHDGLLNVGSAVVAGFAEEVLKQYHDHSGTQAAATLVAVICRAAGVPVIELSAETIEDETAISGTLDEALARVPEKMLTYLLVAKDQKKFRKAFPAFFERVAEVAAQDGSLTDEGGLLESLWPWLAAMLQSKARHFRHSATAAAFAIAKVLSELVARADAAASNAKNRKDAAEAKKRVEALEQQYTSVFAGVLHHRCKDVSPEIRLLAFKTLGELTRANPALNVANRFIKYVSIALHDKKVDIRLEGLDILIRILGECADHTHRCRDYLKHVGPRIVEMAADTDTKVANAAINLAALVVRMGGADQPLLDDDAIDQLLIAVADDRRVMRVSAGTLLRVFIHCRVESSAGPGARAKTLCSFATTLRTAYREPLAERYIVDALWNDPPPMLLADHKHFLAAAREADADTATIAAALGILGAILRRTEGPLDLGPQPKDDQRVLPPATTKETVDPATLRTRLSKDLVPFVAAVLQSHGSDADVQRAAGFAVASLDLEQVAAARLGGQVTELFAELRRVTLLAEDEAAIDCLGAAWAHLIGPDTALRSAAETQLQQLVRAAVRQVQSEGTTGRGSRASQNHAAADETTLAAWRRVAMLSELLSLADHAAVFSHALIKFGAAAKAGRLAADDTACDTAAAIITAAHRAALWLFAAHQEGGASLDEIQSGIAAVLPKLVSLAAFEADGTQRAALQLRAAATCAACDILALPCADFPAELQEEIVAAASDALDQLAALGATLTGGLQDAIRASASTNEFSEANAGVVLARRQFNAVEATIARVALAVSGLFTVRRIGDPLLAAQWMLQWTRVLGVSKPAADVFKTLFHVLRDRISVTDYSALEHTMIVEATKQCESLGRSIPALEQLHQVGLKLASMHFLPTDKFYPAVPAIVRGAVEYAESTSDLVLHAAASYCARLRVADAVAIAANLEARDGFRQADTASQSTFVRAFVSSVRRAAKLEAAPLAAGTTPGRTPGVGVFDTTGGATGGASTVGGATRTGRTMARKRATQALDAAIEEDDILANIVRESHGRSRASQLPSSQAGGSQRARAQPPAEPADPSGWRGRGAKAAPPSASPVRRGASKASAAATSSQIPMTLNSMMNDDEVFIATQEWE